MLMLWNCQSVWIGTDLQRMNQIRDALKAAKILHKVKVKNHLSQWGGRGTLRSSFGSLGNSTDQAYTYEIFVHKKDAVYAQKLIG